MSENYRSREERKKIQQEKKTNKNKNKKKTPLWKKIMLVCLSIFVFCIIVGAGTFLWMIRDVPPFDETLLKDPVSSKLLAADGKTVIAEVGIQKREQIEYEDIPKVLEEAVLSIEDSRFYEHNGMDVKRLLGAVVANFKEGFGAEGGSTITQQVVKNSFFTNEKTLKRKVQELYLAFQLERQYSKQQILTIYLNKILYGGNVYGVGKAAEYYFDLPKDKLKDMTLEQAALLAGIPQIPNKYNPEKYPDKAEARRNTVLMQMQKNGYITEAEMKKAQSTPIAETLKINKKEIGNYSAFVDTVIDEVTTELPGINVNEAGLEIHTTLDPVVQEATEKALAGELGVKFPDDNFQAGIAIVDTDSGEIRAIGGGRNYQKQGFNRATALKRHPGSTFKPIMDYGPAIEKLKWSTAHQLTDEKYTYSDRKRTPINNHDNYHKGPMTMREALVQSRNIPALKALQEVTIPVANDFASDLGISIPNPTESASIGAFDPGTSPLEMAGAYAAFGNGGTFTKPYSVKKVVFNDKTEHDFPVQTDEEAMKDYTAFLITDMLRGVVKAGNGTGRAANVSKLDIAGKTGTTNFGPEETAQFKLPGKATRDSWFVGYTPQYSMGVWTGYDKTTQTDYIKTANDSRISQDLFRVIMSAIPTKTTSFTAPKSVEKVGNEYKVRGGEDIKVPEEKLSKPNVSASHDPASKSIKINWSFQAPEGETATFDVSYSVDGATQSLGTINGTSATIPNAVPGSSYSISVIASTSKGKSEPGTVTVVVPKETTPDPNVPDPNKPDPNKPDPNQPDPNKPDPNKPDPNKPDPNKPDPNKPDPNKPDPNKPDPNKPDPNKPDPNKPNPGDGGNGNNNND